MKQEHESMLNAQNAERKSVDGTILCLFRIPHSTSMNASADGLGMPIFDNGGEVG